MTFEQAIRILTLKSDFTVDQLKSSYRKMAVQTHPDKGGSEKRFNIVNSAYKFLTKIGPQRVRTKEQYGNPFVESGWTNTTVTVESVVFNFHRVETYTPDLKKYLCRKIHEFMAQNKKSTSQKTLAFEVLKHIKRTFAKDFGYTNYVGEISVGGYNEYQVLECLMQIIEQNL